jgi:hypothetical protein
LQTAPRLPTPRHASPAEPPTAKEQANVPAQPNPAPRPPSGGTSQAPDYRVESTPGQTGSSAPQQKTKVAHLQALDPNLARMIEKLDRIIELLVDRTTT